MATLTTAIAYDSSSPAIIIPGSGPTLSYKDVKDQIASLQRALADLGIGQNSAVSISLVNNLEFAISFLAVGAQRAIAATLNPAYQQSEVEFYVDDIKAALMIVAKGSVEHNTPAVRASKKFGIGIAEIWWDGKKVQLELKDKGKQSLRKKDVVQAQTDDIAVCSQFAIALTLSSLSCTPVEPPGDQKVQSCTFSETKCSCSFDP